MSRGDCRSARSSLAFRKDRIPASRSDDPLASTTTGGGPSDSGASDGASKDDVTAPITAPTATVTTRTLSGMFFMAFTSRTDSPTSPTGC